MTDVNSAKAGDARIFIQNQGSSPANAFNYFGALTLGGLSQDLGAGTPIKLPSRRVRNQWEIVDNIPGEIALPTTDFTQRMDKFLRDFWWEQKKNNCRLNAVVTIGICGRPDDVDDFESKIILRGMRLTNFALPALNPLGEGENAMLDLTGSLEMLDFDKFVPISWSEKAGAVVLAEIADVIFADAPSCGDCGESSDGCQKAYALQVANSGSPGLSAQIVYTDDGFATSAALDIVTLGGSSADALAAVGRYLVVVSNAGGGHHVSTFDDVDAGTVNWTAVTGGYDGSGAPNAIYSKSPARSFVVGNGGFVYLMTNPLTSVTVIEDGTATAENLNAVHGSGATIVAVGDNNAVLVSNNDGDSFSLKTGPAAGVSLNTVHVITPKLFWVGAANGNAYYTLNGGDSWTAVEVDASLTAINDIVFVDEVVGYIAGVVGGEARVYRSADSGYSWHRSAPYIANLPSATRYNSLAVCGYNKLLCGGVDGSSDGVLAVAE